MPGQFSVTINSTAVCHRPIPHYAARQSRRWRPAYRGIERDSPMGWLGSEHRLLGRWRLDAPGTTPGLVGVDRSRASICRLEWVGLGSGRRTGELCGNLGDGVI